MENQQAEFGEHSVGIAVPVCTTDGLGFDQSSKAGIKTIEEEIIGQISMELLNRHRGRATILRASGFRLDLQQEFQDKKKNAYHQFAIQAGRCHYATVNIQDALMGLDIPASRLQFAFRKSINDGVKVWISPNDCRPATGEKFDEDPDGSFDISGRRIVLLTVEPQQKSKRSSN